MPDLNNRVIMEWDLIIGLEVHAQLKTKSKLFSGASTEFGGRPNAHACFIDAGLPGVLPVLNKEAVVMAIKLGLALNADIHNDSFFERKNYFYPDLPKGYQISQLQQPIISNGSLNVTLDDGSIKTVLINRAHLEEDAGKSLHEAKASLTGIDLNRAGTPLLEIVTEPCLYSAEEAISYLKTLHQLVRFLDICDGNMQEGSFRCDVNLSLKPKGSDVLGTRTELKNINSFRYIEKAIAYEACRHQDILEQGKKVLQETRLYNPDTNTTQAMRSKENENDYRYFPDPDLLPIEITRMQTAEIKRSMPDLPEKIKQHLQKDLELTQDDIHFILSSPQIYLFYKEIRKAFPASDKLIINWLKGPYAAALNEQQSSFETLPVSSNDMALLLHTLNDKKISHHTAKQIFQALWKKEDAIEKLLEQAMNEQTDDYAGVSNLILEIIQENPTQAADYRAGKEKLFGFFVGLIMKKTQGKINPQLVSDILKMHLNQ